MVKLLEVINSNSLVMIIVKVIIICLIARLILRYCYKIVDLAISKKIGIDKLSEKRMETLGNVVKSVCRYTVYFLCGIAILTVIFGPIPLTFAGIGAAIIGLGTQSLVKDMVSGFFILFEGQYGIGDHVTVAGSEGIVEGVELRVTKIRAFNGNLIVIPNGSVQTVINHSNGPQRIEVFVTIEFGSNCNLAEKVLNESCAVVFDNCEDIVDVPQLIGISEFSPYGIVYRILGRANPLTVVSSEAMLRREITRRFVTNGIKFAKSRA